MATMTSKRRMTVTILVFVLIAAVGLGRWYWLSANQLPVVNAAPSFTLENVQGKSFSSSDLSGKVRLVEFMYASCPDICPMTTANMVQVQKRLQDKGLFGDKVEFVSVTFDPQKDTPAVLNAYADGLGIDQKGWVLLRGTEADTQKVMQDFGAYVEKQPDGQFMHSTTSLFLVDGDNQVRKIYKMGEEMNNDEIYTDIVNLTKRFLPYS